MRWGDRGGAAAGLGEVWIWRGSRLLMLLDAGVDDFDC